MRFGPAIIRRGLGRLPAKILGPTASSGLVSCNFLHFKMAASKASVRRVHDVKRLAVEVAGLISLTKGRPCQMIPTSA